MPKGKTDFQKLIEALEKNGKIILAEGKNGSIIFKDDFSLDLQANFEAMRLITEEMTQAVIVEKGSTFTHKKIAEIHLKAASEKNS